MSAYIICTYDIDDPQAYAGYVEGTVPIILRHGGEIVVADYEAKSLEGPARGVNVVLRFPSEENAMAWFNDPEYKPLKEQRHGCSSNGFMSLAPEFTMPAS